MILFKSRREREAIIVRSMIRIYCKRMHHSHHGLCGECNPLSTYVMQRLSSCVYGEIKPVCKECPVHCYAPAQREQIRDIMRKTGPKMIFHNPLYAILHIFDNATAPKAVHPREWKNKTSTQ